MIFIFDADKHNQLVNWPFHLIYLVLQLRISSSALKKPLKTFSVVSLFVATILAIGQQLRSESSFNNSAYLPLQIRCCLFHFPRFFGDSSTFFLHQSRNSLDRCSTAVPCFLQYRSADVKLLGGE